MDGDFSRSHRNNLALTHRLVVTHPKVTSELWKKITQEDVIDSISVPPCREADLIENSELIFSPDIHSSIRTSVSQQSCAAESYNITNASASGFEVNQMKQRLKYYKPDLFQERMSVSDNWNINPLTDIYMNQFREKIQAENDGIRKHYEPNGSHNDSSIYIDPDIEHPYQKEVHSSSSHTCPTQTMTYNLWEPPGYKDCSTPIADSRSWIYNQSESTPWDSFLSGISTLDSDSKNDCHLKSSPGNRSYDEFSPATCFPVSKTPNTVQDPQSFISQGNQQSDFPLSSDLVLLMEELALNESFKFGPDNGRSLFAHSTLQKPDPTLMKGCVFCKNNNYHSTFYKSHSLKDDRGHCQCPVLRAYVCPLCSATGDAAHTLKYCPKNTVTRGDPISAGLPPGKVTNWREMAVRMMHMHRKRT